MARALALILVLLAGPAAAADWYHFTAARGGVGCEDMHALLMLQVRMGDGAFQQLMREGRCMALGPEDHFRITEIADALVDGRHVMIGEAEFPAGNDEPERFRVLATDIGPVSSPAP